MKHLVTLVFVIVLAGCTVKASTPVANGGVTMIVVTATPVPATATVMPPAATPNPTATVKPMVWVLPGPPPIDQLPTELSAEIGYIEPPAECAVKNDPNVTCSTRKGQVTDGDFVLKAGQALVMTGDAIDISKGNNLLVDRPSLNTLHDLWVVVNTNGKDLSLHMLAPHGSFRGYFKLADGIWNIQKITHLRDLHIYLFLRPPQTYDRFTPTPVPNCESYEGCPKVDVRVVVFDDSGQHVVTYGLYLEGQPFWQDLL